MYRVKNTANDRTKALLHRTAPRFEEAPSIAGRRLRLGDSMDITDEQYSRLKPTLDEWVKAGMVSVTLISGVELKEPVAPLDPPSDPEPTDPPSEPEDPAQDVEPANAPEVPEPEVVPAVEDKPVEQPKRGPGRPKKY